jgi:nicotinic acid mononucleotide adenylyltransferase
MKNYRQLVKELPSKKVVFAFGRFQPPTTGHELLVNAVKKLAGTTADHVIYASKTEDKKSNPLPVARKVYFLKRMFPKTNFVAASAEVRTPIEAAKELNKKYKNIVLVAGSDRVASFQKLLNDYNGKEYHFDTIEVVSAGERDPDSDTASGMSGTKMREAAVSGDFNKFKKGLPHTLTELDGRRLMNDIRKGLGHPIIKEQFIVQKDNLREKYFNGEIFNVGDIVESSDVQYEIVKRGSNHLLLKQE